jgi:phage/plasmid primase-like uncharacterized protein
MTAANLLALAKQLTIPCWALCELHLGVVSVRGSLAYTIPEFDGSGKITGIALRYTDGKKSCLKGSHRGLTLPANWHHGDSPILIVEGASDTAALVAMGIAAVGRPSARGGVEALLQLLVPLPSERQIIVLGEFDPKPDGTWPGRGGAEHVAHALADGLRRPVTMSLPPARAKDVRAWRAS